jgi:hypothetical protein
LFAHATGTSLRRADMSFNVKIDVQAPDFKKIVQPGIRLFDELNRSIQETQNSVKTLMKDYETKTFHSFMNMHCLGGATNGLGGNSSSISYLKPYCKGQESELSKSKNPLNVPAYDFDSMQYEFMEANIIPWKQ